MVAIRRIRIDYTVYPSGFIPGKGLCWDFRTFARAKRKARSLGAGARVYRNFNQANKGQPLGDWWGARCFWVWTGSGFEKRRETGQQVMPN
jgi:hypothetical protein